MLAGKLLTNKVRLNSNAGAVWRRTRPTFKIRRRMDEVRTKPPIPMGELVLSDQPSPGERQKPLSIRILKIWWMKDLRENPSHPSHICKSR